MKLYYTLYAQAFEALKELLENGLICRIEQEENLIVIIITI